MDDVALPLVLGLLTPPACAAVISVMLVPAVVCLALFWRPREEVN